MQDTKYCPICGDLMRSNKLKNRLITFVDKTSDYIERTCAGLNHCLQIFVDEKTKQVDLLKMSLTSKYDIFIFLDYYNTKSQIVCYKNNKQMSKIDVSKIIDPDFPDLKNLKSKVSLFITFL